MNAVLITGIFVVSIFNVQLGQPIMTFIPMPTMEECERFIPLFTGDQKMDIEWTMHMRAQCMTIEEYRRQMALAASQANPEGEQEANPTSAKPMVENISHD